MITFAGGLLTGCVTPRYKEFKNVKQGMEKDQVLSAAGGPNYSKRWKGKDRWIYEMKNTPEGSQTKEVHFEEGKAVYVGSKVVPAVSGEEQDRINEESNVQEEKRLSEQDLAWEAARGVARTQYSGPKPQNKTPANNTRQFDPYDRKFNESTYGVQDHEAEKTRIAPTFEAIQ